MLRWIFLAALIAAPALTQLAFAQSAMVPINPVASQGALVAPAQAPKATRISAAPSTAMVSVADRGFMRTAVEGGIAEVAISRVAAERALHPDVRHFAEMLIVDHTKANDQLAGLARNFNVTIPVAADARFKGGHAKLQKASGQSFDRAFMRAQVTDHKKDIVLFEKQARQGDNAALRHFAEENLPILRAHLRAAEQLAAAVPPARQASKSPSQAPKMARAPAPMIQEHGLTAAQLNEREHMRLTGRLPPAQTSLGLSGSPGKGQDGRPN
jgi:putative membrane protein